ncbi:SNF2-related protein [Priestia flexa]|uniref:SNF2-related protein n=1 Tax=Priestia flexa TaxID=86664 RepID=A0ABU4J348_9BACI|nr:SNF2-related protein [Priestia flexa]MDW8515409.1 SNF2-related protein [Priestia flexa]
MLMFDLFELTLHIDEYEDKLFVYCTDRNQKLLQPTKWKNSLFLWHSSSYYGTTLSPFELDSKSGILLSAWDGFTFFLSIEKGHLLKPTFSKEAREYLDKALKLKENLLTVDTLKQSLLENNDSTWEKNVLEFLFLNHTYQLLEEANIPYPQSDYTVSVRFEEPLSEGSVWEIQLVAIPTDSDQDPFLIRDEMIHEYKNGKTILYEVQRIKHLSPTLRNALSRKLPTLSDEELWNFLTKESNELLQKGVHMQLPSWWKEIKKGQIQVQAVHEDNQTSAFGIEALTNFKWSVSIDSHTLTEKELNELIKKKKQLLKLDGQWIHVDSMLIKKAKKLLKEAQQRGVSIYQVLRAHLNQPFSFDSDCNNVSIKYHLNSYSQSIVSQLKQAHTLPSIRLSSAFNGRLRQYQQVGLNWLLHLRKIGLGGLLADDMGLGKTIQLISYFTKANELSSAQKPFLLICPTSLIGNWEKELDKFAPYLKVYTHYGRNRLSAEDTTSPDEASAYDLIITTYQLVAQEPELFQTRAWDTICLDEAQHIKNPHTKQAKAVKKLNTTHRFALTGTPIENRLTELWSIVDFLNPGYLDSLERFKKEFVIPIEKEQNLKKAEQLKALLSPILLRRTKLDKKIALDLPDKQEEKVHIELTAEQKVLYEELVHSTLNSLKEQKGIERSGQVLQLLTKLKLLCNHPALLLKEPINKQTITRSPKLEKTVELLKQIKLQNESCLIFTQYLETGNMLKRILKRALKEDVLFLHGGLSKAERDDMVASFQSGQHSIFILSLRSGGVGLNLTAANHVIHFDRWWNPAVENQATDRVYRIGQQKFVHIHKLLSLGTIEEKIDDMMTKKYALSEQLVQNDKWITELSQQELQELLQYN